MLNNPDIEVMTGHSGMVDGRPTLVLIHGSGGTAASWGAQINPLDRHLNVLALSLPGHGKTRGPLLESALEYGRWIERTLETLRVPEPCILCGISFGGAVALESVRLNAKRYRGLVLISTGATLNHSVEIIGQLGENWPEAARRFIHLIFADNGKVRVREISYTALLAAGPEILFADLAASRQFDFRNQLKDISIPCLVIGGEEDRVVPPEKWTVLTENIPDAQLIMIKKAGHMVIVEQFRMVNDAILKFVTDIGISRL